MSVADLYLDPSFVFVLVLVVIVVGGVCFEPLGDR